MARRGKSTGALSVHFRPHSLLAAPSMALHPDIEQMGWREVFSRGNGRKAVRAGDELRCASQIGCGERARPCTGFPESTRSSFQVEPCHRVDIILCAR